MGVVGRILDLVFGGGRNVVAETAEVFRENSEKGAARDHDLRGATLAQFGGEFRQSNRGRFDRVMDGINRLPRPLMALGCIGLFVAAMVDPLWFAARMQGVALVPEPLWWLLGVVVSFYFGARHQAKGQQFQRDIAQGLVQSAQVVNAISQIESLASESPTQDPEINPALAEWKRSQS
ncbi:holin family protein [Cognatishimia sp.]|uniref:holin family protein n=1 Tax=Cognatishimia sp. TaxID=2211648 RepID=UPI003515BCFD|nr:holin family protein [Cognatishimia sp.]